MICLGPCTTQATGPPHAPPWVNIVNMWTFRFYPSIIMFLSCDISFFMIRWLNTRFLYLQMSNPHSLDKLDIPRLMMNLLLITVCSIKFYDDLNSELVRSNTHVLLEFWETSTTLEKNYVNPQLNYFDCLHKVCVGDQLGILPSVFNTQNVCTSVVMIPVRRCGPRSVFTNIVMNMNNSEHVVMMRTEVNNKPSELF